MAPSSCHGYHLLFGKGMPPPLIHERDRTGDRYVDMPPQRDLISPIIPSSGVPGADTRSGYGAIVHDGGRHHQCHRLRRYPMRRRRGPDVVRQPKSS